MAQVAVRRSHGLVFECPSPSVWHMVGAPVTLGFDGRRWQMTTVDRFGAHMAYFDRRDEAVVLLAQEFGGADEGLQ